MKWVIFLSIVTACVGSASQQVVFSDLDNQKTIVCFGERIGVEGSGMKMSDVVSGDRKINGISNESSDTVVRFGDFLKLIGGEDGDLLKARLYLDQEAVGGMPILAQSVAERKSFAELYLNSRAQCVFDSSGIKILYCYSDSSRRYLLPVSFEKKGGDWLIVANKSEAEFKGKILGMLSSYGGRPVKNWEPVPTSLPKLSEKNEGWWFVWGGVGVVFVLVCLVIIWKRKGRDKCS